MKKILLIVFTFSQLFILTISSWSQVSQFPQVYNNYMGSSSASNLNIRQTPSLSGSVLQVLPIGGKIGAETQVTNTSDTYMNWIKVCLPSTTGNITYGYMACNEFYARIDPTNNYATVTATSLNIRPTAGSTTQWVTIGGQNAMFGQNSIVALTGTTSIISGTTWYQVYLTLNCSQTTGWLSGAFLSIAPSQNYRTVGGRVCDNASNCNFLGNINGATITFGSIGSTLSSSDFYQYKLPTNWSGTIACSHPNYNTSTPTSYSHTASSHNYTRHFVLTNTCAVPNQPSNLTVNSVSSTSVNLSWSGVSGTGITYEVLKNNTSCSFVFGSSGLTTSSTSGTVTGLTPGTQYYFVVIARNACGNSSNSNCVTATTNSTVSIPVANFVTANGVIVTGQSATIFDASSNTPTSWSWTIQKQEFNGSLSTVYTSSSQHITYNFPQPACYRVRLTATNAAGSNTLTRDCFIYATPNLTVPIPPDVTRAQKYYTYKGGDPVNLANGTFNFSMRDLTIPDIRTVLQLERRYFSNSGYEGPFGMGWHHSFDIKLTFSNNVDWFVQYPDGHNEHFVPYPNGEAKTLYPGNFDSLSYTLAGGVPSSFTLRLKDGTRWEFNDEGQIRYIYDLDGNQTTFSYSGGKLITITGPGGRYILFTYNAFNRIVSANDNSNRTVYYYYDATGQYLDSTRIGNSTTSFRYGPHGMTEVYDPKGNRIVLNVFNAQSQVYEQYDADNNKTSFQYNTPSTGQTTVTDPLLKSKVIKHDDKARCIETKNELNSITKYSYSLHNEPDTITDARGFKTVKVYDAKNNEIKTTNAKGFSDSIGYTILNKPDYVRDKEGSVHRTLYSSSGNPTHIILATGDTLRREYDSRGLDTTVINPRGFKTRKVYNSYGDLVQVTTPSSVTTTVYDAIGRPIEITDSYGRKDSLFWNYFDLLVKRKDKLGRTEEYEYDQNGNQTSYKDKNGQITITQFNKHDKLVRVVEPQNHITEYEYDENQRRRKIRDPKKNVLLFTYDDAGREIAIADSVLGVLSQKTYDASGNLITVTDALNKTWINRVDEINRITSTVNPLGDSIQFKYDKNNQPTEQIDEEGRSTKWEYDLVGRHFKTRDARNNFIQRYLNKNGLLDSVRDARGNTRNKSIYDGSDRVLTLNDGFGNYSMLWDSSGNTKKITDPDSRILDYFYNANNELVDIKNNGTAIRHFVLDNNGDYTSASSFTQNATVIRNQLGWITHYTDNYANTIEHIYDSTGNVKKIIYPGGKQVEYEYNSLNKCTQVKDWINGIYTIVRNNKGEITSIQYPNNFKTEITRDDASRVSAWLNKDASNNVFQSNLIRRSISGDIVRDSGLHVLSLAFPTQTANGTYGKDDRLITYGTIICTTNTSGQRTNLFAPGKSYSYTWSPMSELNSTTHTGFTQTMQYDAFNERVLKVTPQGTTRYIVEHNLASFSLVLQERDNTNQEVINYLYIPGDGIVLARDSVGTLRYYHHDVKGNTSALSDVNGLITDRYEYGISGDTINHTGSSTQPFTWMGMYGVQHDGNGLYYLHARYYDGKTGTFISKDPHPINYLNTQDVNRYVYGYNNPLKYIDPTGLSAVNNISYENLNKFKDNLIWQKDEFLEFYEKIKSGHLPGTGFFQDAYNYAEQEYIKSVVNGKPNNWYLVGLGATSIWIPENAWTTVGAFTLKTNFSGIRATKVIGKTGLLKLIDMRTALGLTIKQSVGLYDAYNVVKKSYEGIYKKRDAIGK